MSFTELLQPSSSLTTSKEWVTQGSTLTPASSLVDPLQSTTAQSLQAFHASSPSALGTGDTIATATNIGTLNGTYTTRGAIDYYGDVDFFRFRLNTTTNLNIALTQLTADADLQLLNSAGAVISSSTLGGTASDSINYQSLAAGDYYVRINPFSLNLTGYQLSLSTTTVSNLIAPEINMGSLSGTRVFSDSVGSADTSDVYGFSLSNTQSINMTLSGLGSDADIRLIRDFNGNGLIDTTDILQSSTNGGTNAEWMSRTLGPGNYFVQVYQYTGNTNYNFTISTGDWYSSNLRDAGVIGQARTFAQDSVLSRLDMMSLLRETRDGGVIDAIELTDLRRVVSGLGYLMPDHVRVLSNKIVNSDPANNRSGIGNLYAGSSAAQIDRLIDKWFMGGDRPTEALGTTYRYTSGSLFQNGISATDIRQSSILGDCYFLATLGAYANDRPSVIQNIFIDNGDGTFTVRFFNNGAADYVTVDRYLPTNADGTAIYAGWNGGSYLESNNELWVALAEKAYAQMNQSGWLGRDNTNSYAGIENGWMAPVMRQLAGTPALSQSVNSMTPSQLISLVNSNVPITAGFVSGRGFGVVNEHAYTITSYDPFTGRFHLNNPWGHTHADVSLTELRQLNAQIEWG